MEVIRKVVACFVACVICVLATSCAETDDSIGDNYVVDEKTTMCHDAVLIEVQDRFGVPLEGGFELPELINRLERSSFDFDVIHQRYRSNSCDEVQSIEHTGYVKLNVAEPFEQSTEGSLVETRTLESFIFLFNDEEVVVWVERRLTAFGP